MMDKTAPKVLATTMLASLLVLGATTTAEAAQPPAGYPTSQIMANVSNPLYGTIPIRRGFYDSDIDKGFGMDKAWHKHNITSLAAQIKVMKSTNGTKQGNGNIALRTTVTHYISFSGGPYLSLGSVTVIGVYAPNSATYISGWPVGGKIGLLTAYCSNDDNSQDCAWWVTSALERPDNAYYQTVEVTARTAGDPTPSEQASPSPTPSRSR